MKSVIERMAEDRTDEKIARFRQNMTLPYEEKVAYALRRATEFAQECDRRGLTYHVSVGGLDSITLLLFLREYGVCYTGISVSGLEDRWYDWGADQCSLF